MWKIERFKKYIYKPAVVVQHRLLDLLSMKIIAVFGPSLDCRLKFPG